VFTQLLDAVGALGKVDRRLIVGIAGPPGAGKTTLAEELAGALGGAPVVPMDGFHLSNGQLRRLGLAQVKGAPETFDVAGYVALLRRIRESGELVYAPSFDHVMNEPIAGSIPVYAEAAVVVTEGNYLLAWPQARRLLDLAVHLDTDATARVAGLIERQRAKGLDAASARDWVLRSDEANARLVQRFADLADLRLTR
jgi:pantothenate kinase